MVVGSDSTASPCSSHSGKPPRNQYTDLKPLVSATRAALYDFQHSAPLQWKITALFLSSSWGPAHSSIAGSCDPRLGDKLEGLVALGRADQRIAVAECRRSDVRRS